MNTDYRPEENMEIGELLERVRKEDACLAELYESLHLCDFNYYYETTYTKPTMPSKGSIQSAVRKNHGIGFIRRKILRFKSLFNDDTKKELELRKKFAEEEIQTELLRLENIYYEDVKQYELIRTEERDKLKNCELSQVISYFSFVLESDDFFVNALHQYENRIRDIDYNKESKVLELGYRLPYEEEVPPVLRINVDKKTGMHVYKGYDVQKTKERRQNTARAVLLRAMKTVFESDDYQCVDKISATGYLYYFDEISERDEQKPLIELDVSRDQIRLLDMKQNMESLFKSKLDAKEAPGFYVASSRNLNEPKAAKAEQQEPKAPVKRATRQVN